MDGLPTSLNTLGVVETSVHTAWALYKYVNDVKNAKSDIKELGKEINAHLSILEKVKDLLENQSGRLQVSQELRSALDTNYSKLANIKRQLDEELAVQSSRRKQILNRLRGPSQRQTVELEVEKLRKSREDIRVALEIDKAKIIIDIHDVQSEEVLATLPVVEGAAFDAHANEHEPKCHPGTRVKILEEISKWAQNPDGRRIYWLYGMAGTGKSTICRTIAHHLVSLNITTASFFFKKGDGNRDKAGGLFTTIVKQLIEHLPKEMVQHVKQALQDNPSISDKSLSKQFEALLLKPLTKCKSLPSVIVVVLDALDECDDQANAARIIELLPGVETVSSTSFKVLVASRPECHLRMSFAQLNCKYDEIYLQAALHEVADEDVQHDISVFLKFELEMIRNRYNLLTHLQLPADWPSRSLVEDLVDMSMPLFILAATACRFIGDKVLGIPDERAQKFLQHRQLGRSNHLARTYLPILEQLFVKRNGTKTEDRPEAEKREITKEFRRIVGTIVLLEAPLSIISLSELLKTSPREIDLRLSSLHSVLNVPNDPNSPIKLFHLSFRDFLTGAGDQDEKHDFLVDESETHANLARQCLALLMMDNNVKQDICGLTHPGTLRSDIDQRTIDTCFPPHVRYACVYWVFHLKKGGARIYNNDEAYSFLTRHLIHWLEALSLLGLISESLNMVDSLLTIVDDNSESSSLLRDTKRFIRTYQHIMDIAPLQIYSSALVFAPKRSDFRRRFEEAIPDWIKHQPTVPTEWDSCLQTLEHDDKVYQVVISPDSSLIASETRYKILIWRTQSGTCVHELEVEYSHTFVFSRDSRLFHVVLHNGDVETWETDTWTCKEITELDSTPRSEVVCPTISQDCKLFAAAFPPRQEIIIWPFQTLGDHINIINFNGSCLKDLAFSPDSTYLIGKLKSNKEYIFWHIGSGRQTEENCWGVAYSPDSSLMALGKKRAIKIRRVETNSLTRELPYRYEGFRSSRGLTFSHDAALLAIYSHYTIEMWLTDTGECIWRVNAHTDFITSLSFSHDSTFLVSSSVDSMLHIYSVSKHQSAESHERKYEQIDSVTLSPDSSLISLRIPYPDGCVGRWYDRRDIMRTHMRQILRADSGVCVGEFNGTNLQREPIFTQDSTLAILKDGTAEIWHPDRPQHVRNLEGLGSDSSSRIQTTCFSADLTLAAALLADGSLRIWQMDTGACIRAVESAPDNYRIYLYSYKLCFSPDASRILAYSETGGHFVWQVKSDALAQKFEPRFPDTTCVALSNTKLAAALNYGDLAIWSLEQVDNPQQFHDDRLKADMLAFSTDSTLLASRSANPDTNIIEVWNADTGAHLHTIPFNLEITHLSFEPNTSSGLRTNVGRIKLENFTVLSADAADDGQCQRWHYDGLGYGNDDYAAGSWITFNGKRLLWLPAEYRERRGTSRDVSNSAIATVSNFRRNVFIKFNMERLSDLYHTT